MFKSAQLNKLENNIKNAINNMRVEIEKKEKLPLKINTISPDLMRNKLISNTDLKIVFKTKKTKNKRNKNRQTSLLIKETDILNTINYFGKRFF